ncbi:oxidoreductase [Thalassobius sp. I31.1]|uniref:oxidoreductase n=1 Tax=Thalassobius sp. I31.1 TaxID=2109912 RepID=UPI000D1B64A6|nr:oxidoreductase [Thalassobius sp. I31.1]
MKCWKLNDIPDLTGRAAVVTGGNVGLGFRSAMELCRKGADVVIACRRPDAGQAAITRILAEVPDARIRCITMDLTDFTSVQRFADEFREGYARLDILLNNAGVVNLEQLRHTADGHEMHMATNHYGHFALTGHLFGLLCATPGARVVTVSSGGYRAGEIRFDDMDWRKRPYSRLKSYGTSKLANVLFMRALQRRFEAAGADAISLGAHPGLSGTERQQSIGMGGWLTRILASPVAIGVAPQLCAATCPTAQAGEYYGPRFGIRGAPRAEEIKPVGCDDDTGEKLWTLSAEVIGVSFG